MLPDFYNAFHRHLNDADYLYNDSRWPNADQLYAYSAECGLKCIMQLFGMYINPTSGKPSSRDMVHADGIWHRYEAYRSGRGVTGYELPQPNPFDNWKINQRYAGCSNITKANVDVHKKGAIFVKRLINKAIIEGRLII